MIEKSDCAEAIEQLHLARSKCIDAFVMAEEAIIALLVRSNSKCGAGLTGQRMEILRKAKPGPQYSKAKRTAVHPLLDDLERLLPIRADFVHGKLHMVRIEGELFACFVNARNAGSNTQVARLISPAQFAQLTRHVANIAHDLAQS